MKSLVYETPINSAEELVARISAAAGEIRNTPEILSNVRRSMKRRFEACITCGGRQDALDHALNSNKDSIWILTDSRSSIHYLKKLRKITDNTGLYIISKLARLGKRKEVCLQWIPSHEGVLGNEAVEELSGTGCDLPNPSSSVLSHPEIYSLRRTETLLLTTSKQLRVRDYLYSAGNPGFFRRPWRALEEVTCVV
ncbi:RNase H domain-containing protein [Trichonephila clavipes]|uniref:RNase H domain-containing protein n=1 Tax=Trichonephila clavipes TaxID=2585209 RepID=A0A8X6W850_TRICX|nr:RNase H domain-containing protein [Trichonephila clavipes]